MKKTPKPEIRFKIEAKNFNFIRIASNVQSHNDPFKIKERTNPLKIEAERERGSPTS